MAREFKLEDPGEGLHEAEIVEIQVSAGDQVEDGDIVFVVETDKALMDLPAPFSGTVEEIRVEEDDVVEVGDVLLTYTPADEDAREEGREDSGQRESSEAEKEEPSREEPSDTEKAGREELSGTKEDEPSDTEDVGKEESSDGEEEEDAGDRSDASEEPKEAEAGVEEGESRETPVPASPATRRLARELDVDLREVSGSGPEGRVTLEDVRGFAEEDGGEDAGEEGEEEVEEGAEEGATRGEEREGGEREESQAQPEGEQDLEVGVLPFRTLVKKTPPLPDFSRWGPVRRKSLRSVRRSVARRMTLASWEIPHVAHHDIVDITELERFRREHEERVSREGGQLSLTVLLVKATVVALKEHPRFNASLDVDAEEIVYKDYYNVGLAVDTEQGLVVPVIRGADGKSLTELAREIPELVDRVRAGEATTDDVRGGTFTVTNPGPIGGTHFSPMIRHPEVAILGTAAARLEPVVEGDLDDYEIVPRLRLPVVLAFDHRVNDGADAARFMNTVVETLGDLDSLLLNL